MSITDNEMDEMISDINVLGPCMKTALLGEGNCAKVVTKDPGQFCEQSENFCNEVPEPASFACRLACHDVLGLCC
jgi:hypothetical protein